MFERAIIRSQINLYFTQGFNPHPKISLPLPRSVAMASDDEMLCVELCGSNESAEVIRQKLSEQLPEGCEITGAEVVSGRVSPKAIKVEYLFLLSDQNNVDENIKEIKTKIASNEQLLVDRIGKKGAARKIDIAPYIDSMEYDGRELSVWCVVTGGGTVRVEELFDIFHIDKSVLLLPVKRKQVLWEMN
jgi:radical SAM-linked protein